MDLPASPGAPDWIDFSPDSVRGLDLLGLRLPVQTIGLSLFNGVTTISPKVRYLSFRTFIADAYRTAPGPPPDSLERFLAFARQAEAALALGNALVDPDVTNVVGIDKAQELLEDHDTNVPLEKLVSQLAVNAYAGPAQDLNLVGIRAERAPSVDEHRGLPLANALRKTWGSTALGQRFLDGEAPDSATRTDLEEFGHACQVDQPSGQERDLIIQAILPENPYPDEVERLRTYALLLQLASERSTTNADRPLSEEDIFLAARQPHQVLPEVLIPALDGWLVYQVRDSLAVAHEAALGEVVQFLGSESVGTGGIPSRRILGGLLEDESAFSSIWADLGLPDMGQELMKVRVSALLEVLESACAEEVDEREGLRRWGGTLGEWELMQARKGYGTGALLLLPLSWFLAARRTEEGIREGLPLFDGLSLGGSSRLGMKEILIPRLRRFVEADATIGEVIADLTTLTVHQHVQIALSRLAQDPRRDVSVIGIDGTHWIKERDYPPGRTASRLHQAISWLQQLGLITQSAITAEGESVLERTLTTLKRTATA